MKEKIEQQKRAMHDTRQLLRNAGTLAKEGKQEELLKYIDEAMDYTTVSDKRFCPNACVNGLLNYYAGLAEARNIDFSVRAVCDRLPFSNADMTILLGNALRLNSAGLCRIRNRRFISTRTSSTISLRSRSKIPASRFPSRQVFRRGTAQGMGGFRLTRSKAPTAAVTG